MGVDLSQIQSGWDDAERAARNAEAEAEALIEQERLVREQAADLAAKGEVIATMNVPISINALKTTLKRLKERYGSKVQVVPYDWGLAFVLHRRGVVPK